MRLVPLESVRPSTYNPRQADPKRLELVELSLRKLGFVLPLYADQAGEILSGHQRHYVAARMGARQVPVAYTQAMPLAERKAVNIAFNRGTNDLRPQDTPRNLTEALERSNIHALAAALPDREPDTPEFYPCLQARETPIGPLLQANRGRWVQYACNVSKTLRGKGVVMPLVATPNGHVVNGLGRLQMLAERKAATAPVVTISEEEAAFADAMLNLLSMDFDLHNRYADLLRHNSFRRARNVRGRLYGTLGLGFRFAVNIEGFSLAQPEHRKRWAKEHGTRILDFGAGHLTETEALRAAGFQVTAFEPYRIGKGDVIDRGASVMLARQFLQAVASGVIWDSVFISSVLNSVPFAEDRRHIVTICAALCSAHTRVYAHALARSSQGWTALKGGGLLSPTNIGTLRFTADYEPGITVGDIGARPKVQKYHTAEEFQRLFGERFAAVQVRERAGCVQAVCGQARPVAREALRAAIAFEFDLPYPDGTRMGLVDDAIAAFSTRLGVAL